MTVDPFTLEICRNRLDSIVQEMATALIKTSSSPTTTETKDFSTSLFDYKGRQLAFSGYILYHASSNWEGIQAIIRDYPLEEIHEGDVFMVRMASPQLGKALMKPSISKWCPLRK